MVVPSYLHYFLVFTLFRSLSLVICSFCRHQSEKKISFPLPTPDNVLIPWIWDAIFDENLRRVEITVVPRLICSFNQTRWRRVVELFPQYSETHFAGGNQSNILVSFTPTLDFYLNMSQSQKKKTKEKKVYQKNTFDSMVGERFTCVFYDEGHVLELATSEALIIQGSSAFMSSSSFQVICPVPKSLSSFDEMMLQRHFVWDNNERILLRRLTKGRRIHGDEGQLTTTVNTARFPVCRLSRLYKDLQLSRSSTDKIRTNIPSNEGSTIVTSTNRFPYLYNLSICTVTNRVNFNSAMEWIEYHRLVGVEHFFIYNTARPPVKRDLEHTYAAFTNEGLVTLIDWPYENCAINMSSGRQLYYREKNPLFVDESLSTEGYHQQGSFKPPYCLAQHAALASCYARYRKLSKYMLLIDDDEFVVVRSRRKKTRGNEPTLLNKQSLLNERTSPALIADDSQSRESSRSLTLFADKYFAKHQKIGGLKFAPIIKGRCELKKNKWENVHVPDVSMTPKIREEGSLESSLESSLVNSLPRIGTWTHGRVGEQNEGKLLVRTEKILSVTVHFFLQPEPGQKVNRQFFLMPYTEGALLHYKSPHTSGDIYGAYLDDKERLTLCSQIQHFGGFLEGVSPLKGSIFQKYNNQNISMATKRVRWFYEEWHVTADQAYPYLQSVHPMLQLALVRRITAMRKKAVVL